MTLGKFNRLLKKVNPKLRLRYRHYGDVGGVFAGKYGKGGYIARITKGELHLNGYRLQVVDPNNELGTVNGNIKKRGRKTLINLLRNWRWIKNHRQRSTLLWGIEYGG